MSDKPTKDEALAAVAYFRSTSNRHDLCDILAAYIGPADKAPAKEELPNVDSPPTGRTRR